MPAFSTPRTPPPPDEPCNRKACRTPGATYFNPHTGAYYCTPCATEINKWLGRAEPLFEPFSKDGSNRSNLRSEQTA